MKKLSAILFSFIFLSSVLSFAQMTDSQVVDYLKSAASSGKSQTEMQRELLLKGVTKEQLLRIKNQYESGNKGAANTREVSGANPRSKKQSMDVQGQDNRISAGRDGQYAGTEANVAEAGGVSPDRNMKQGANLFADGRPESRIFGHSMFTGTDLSFEPNENVATPEDYKLGPGDQVIIEIWGYSEASISQTISPEGKITISQIGPVYLSGLTIKEASEKIKKALRAKYSGIGGDTPNSEVSITLGEIRTIQVNVMGEVKVPGTYRLSSFATVFSALYRAGGVTDTGSLRDIKVVRGGEKVADVDVYGYLFNGRSDSDIRLQDGDIVIVPPYVKLVELFGGVKRPMLYEMSGDETVADALKYSGGFSSSANKTSVRVERKSGKLREVFTVPSDRMAYTGVEDGDFITADTTFVKYANRLEVQGYVNQPGLYELGGGISTVKDLVRAAGGLREDAFLPRAVITRERDDLSLETVSVPLGAIMKGTVADVKLKKNDILLVSGMYEIQDRGILTINGLVSNPGSFPYAENTSVEDLIIMAGGLLDGASLARVDVARRVIDLYSTMPKDTIGQTFNFAIKDGLAVDGADEFILKPYDVVSVRLSPAFQKQQFVKVTGEVAFPGEYVLLDKGETISDVIARAGGVTNRAYPKGGTLHRLLNDEEKALNAATRKFIEQGDTKDSLDVKKLDFAEKYPVGINLEKALESPDSQYDITLREGDEIIVPELLNTVRIQGTVMYPNTVVYVPGKGVEYYINAAGGYANRAKRSKVFIIYMNGNVTRAKVGAKVMPGCEIIVPSKGEKKEMSTGEILSIGTSTASLATMIATLVRLFN